MKPPVKTVVMKFGGTSVGDVARISGVAKIVSDYRVAHPDTGVVVVLSAMAGETNRLVTLAKSCVAIPDPREMDVLLASGEQVTVALLAMKLIESGIAAKSFLGPQVRISTNGRHTNAHIEEIDTDSIREVIESGGVPIVAGFQGVDSTGDITTLGRGGSDITAVALAAALRSEICFIYTDVRGVFSTDPRMCSTAKLIPKIAHEEMLELASLGAKVLHTRSVYFAMRYEVPLVVLSTFDGEFEPGKNGTWIVPESELLKCDKIGEKMEAPVVTGVTHKIDEARIFIEQLPADITTLTKLFDELSARDVFIDMISQESVEGGLLNVSITVPDENSAVALQVVSDLVPKLGALRARIERDIAKVSVVGIGMRYHTGVAARMFRALASERINIQMINTSEIKISVLVPRKYCEVAVRVLHEEFIDTKN